MFVLDLLGEAGYWVLLKFDFSTTRLCSLKAALLSHCRASFAGFPPNGFGNEH
jgi:hypothetical protein